MTTQFDAFMYATENFQDNIADKMTVRLVQKEMNKAEGFEFSSEAIKRMIQRAKEIFDEKNIFYPEGY